MILTEITQTKNIANKDSKSKDDDVLRDGYIFEIVVLRRKSYLKKININKQKSILKGNSHSKINIDDDIIWDLKVVRVIKNIK